jgi:hypothetical protein
VRGDARLAASDSEFVEQAFGPLQILFATAGVVQVDGLFQQINAGLYLTGLPGLLIGDAFQCYAAHREKQFRACLIGHILGVGKFSGALQNRQLKRFADFQRLERDGGDFFRD